MSGNVMHGRCFFAITVIVATLVGCSKPKPPPVATFKTTGVVTYKDGTVAPRCIVQFAPESEPGLNISAITEEDGSFELTTLYGNDNLVGAVAGPCSVMVTLPIVGPIPKTLKLKKTYEITEGDNHFEIKLTVMP